MTHDIEIYNENDPSDPDYGPPETWGLWADRDTIELGPAFSRTEVFDDPGAPDPDQLPGEEVALTEPPDDWPLAAPRISRSCGALSGSTAT